MAVSVIHTIEDLVAGVGGRRPAFAPTMGALHAGHAALIRRAREVASESRGAVVVSIFVNPTQFGPSEDFTRYPRQLEQDVALCAEAGADFVFAPSVNEMYPSGPERVAADFVMPPLPEVATQPQLEDRFRPTHFAGVVKVVARLFDIVQPAQAFFGEKDFQQLRVISEMLRAAPARWPSLQIVPHATVRERDGLAMSSRNVYLSPEQRRLATTIWRALTDATRQAMPGAAEQSIRRMLAEAGFDIDYAAVRDAETLMPVERFDRPSRALIAARIGTTRLIDNMAIAPK